VDQIQQLDPSDRARARFLVQTVLDLHEAALAQLVYLIRQEGDAGRAFLEKVSRDGLVSNLLLLHGLHPSDLETRTQEALLGLQPFLLSQGAEVELIAIADDAVRLCLHQNGSGYPALGLLRAAIEETIATAAPEVRLIEFVEQGTARNPTTSRVPLPILTHA
jgi:hypothetical protein